MQFSVTTDHLDSHLVLGVHGDIDLATSPALREYLLGATTQQRPIVADLSAVGFMDATGLSALCDAYDRAAHLGGSLLVAAPQRMVRRILAITELDQCLPIYATVREAVKQASTARAHPFAGAAAG